MVDLAPLNSKGSWLTCDTERLRGSIGTANSDCCSHWAMPSASRRCFFDVRKDFWKANWTVRMETGYGRSFYVGERSLYAALTHSPTVPQKGKYKIKNITTNNKLRIPRNNLLRKGEPILSRPLLTLGLFLTP